MDAQLALALGAISKQLESIRRMLLVEASLSPQLRQMIDPRHEAGMSGRLSTDAKEMMDAVIKPDKEDS